MIFLSKPTYGDDYKNEHVWQQYLPKSYFYFVSTNQIFLSIEMMLLFYVIKKNTK